MLWVVISTVHLTVCSCHVTYAIQSESRIYFCLNVYEILAWNMHHMWSSSDSNETQNRHKLARNRKLNHLAKLVKWLACVASTYLYRAFDCMFLSCDVRISECIHTLYLPQYQGTPYSKQARYLKFKWLQQDKNPKPLNSLTNTQTFGQIILLCFECLSVRWILMYILGMSRTHFRVDPHSIFAWISRNSLLQTGTISKV